MPETRARVAVQACADYEAGHVERAVQAALDGLGGETPFVRPGQRVLLKPNLLSPRAPEEAVTTHPAVVLAVGRLCRAAGATVWIGDSCAGDHPDETLWEKTGMRAVAAELEAELKSCNGPVASRACGGTQVPVPAWLSEVDVVISLAKLKTHALTVMTCALKNTYGLVCGSAKANYHASYPSPRTMSAFLIDVHLALRPSLTIVDAVVAMEGDGPAAGRPRQVGLILAGRDAAAVDTVCADMFGTPAARIPILKAARDKAVGCTDRQAIEVVGDGGGRLAEVTLRPSIGRMLQHIPEPVFHAATRLLACRPRISSGLCVKCGVCERICSRKAIGRDEKRARYRIDAAACILCMCCAESCPRHAIVVRSPFNLLAAARRIVRRVVRA